ncbi:MAG: NTP transferase domain-containing protein [Methanospirillum sp.]|uniref:bifunctional sugar-1-phosphate nucleotidylyltransferase/acetyltransferase n=1 Tax=Methanospirillum sp. TaxID=45200 RepID=UPI0023758AC3|nr:bifunctional sugar-1-phosphate nucleotidylyltransferase/acetyltransferase [Methanospirillum sp.]MDD1730100.1 NTP transferase domain-containing protein [Methanospirillum sp.]
MVQCVILAAGEGKRMRPLTGSRPKVMLPVANRPMLEHLICTVRDAGISEVILVVGYEEAAVRHHFGDGSPFGVTIRYVTQKRQRGTGDAVMSTMSHITGSFLLLNGDMILSLDDIRNILSSPVPAMGICQSEHPQDFGVVTIENGIVTGLEEKSDKPKTNLINAGLYLLNREIGTYLDQISPSPRGELELTDALEPFIREGRLHAVTLSSWVDLGSPWDLLNANEVFLASLSSLVEGEIEDGVVIKGPVQVGKGTIVKSGTYIEGPCIIGINCRVGPHAYIRGATAIGDNCHIGHSIELKNSIVMSNTNIPHFNYVGDSVIASGCNFGAGTKIANLRHDKKHISVGGVSTRRKKFGAIIGDDVLFGINCSVNVGSVIGNRCRIAPHTFVEGVISDDSVVKR